MTYVLNFQVPHRGNPRAWWDTQAAEHDDCSFGRSYETEEAALADLQWLESENAPSIGRCGPVVAAAVLRAALEG